MSKKIVLKVFYLLSVLSLFLPWFTYNAKVMGYRWGFQFMAAFIIPLIIIGIYILHRKACRISVLAEIFSVVNIILLVIIFGKWQQFCNIKDGFYFNDGFKTALPGFYISFLLFTTFFAVLEHQLIKERASEK